MIKNILYLPFIISYIICDSNTKGIISKDVNRYLKWIPETDAWSQIKRFEKCMDHVEFRSIFSFRIKQCTSKISKIFSKIGNVFLPNCKTIEISGRIRGGIFVSHNHCVVCPESAGENLRIGPGAVIGRNDAGYPVIGNNVYIAANASVIGKITIGNNVIIGAGAVVVKDVPDNVVCAGNPAHVIREIKESDYNEIM